jgi:hypothetical protein
MSAAPLPVRFDESLGVFVSVLIDQFGRETVDAGRLLRDASGRLAFIAAAALPDEVSATAATALMERMPAYCREGRIILDPDRPGVSALLRAGREHQEEIPALEGGYSVRVLEQRIVGQDWLESPAPAVQPPAPPRFVFASLKGGVGRSTALAVVAADLARRGRKVLVVDLDLEAPGIGAILLAEESIPRFGLLDWYVEGALTGADRTLLLDMIAASDLGAGRGLIDVAPAIGACGLDYPANVLAKIARAYLDQPSDDGRPLGFLRRTGLLLDTLSGLKSYDAVLIDARAGLNETTAAAILGLGAQVLLFGEDSPQTFAGYRYLLAHLARFPRDEEDDWLYRLRMIHAKAAKDEGRQQAFRDSVHKLFKNLIYRELPLLDLDGVPIPDLTLPELSLDDPQAPHFAWPVLRDSNYFDFNPLAEPSQLTPALYESSYRSLIAGIDELLTEED